MAIFDKQYKKLLAIELLKSFLEGKLPNINEIAKRVSTIIGRGSNTMYSYKPQPYKNIFNIRTYNKGLKQIKFDIDLLYEEIIDLINDSIKKSNFADMYYKVHTHELNRLKQTLDNLLFVTNNTDFYFEGGYDDFSSLEKTDLDSSTQDVVNLSETVIALPFGAKGTTKINIDSFSGVTFPINITTDANNIYSSKPLPGSRFENIFLDTISFWAQEIITHEAKPVELYFTFQLKPGEVEILLNRLELIPYSIKEQQIIVKLSNDNVNYFAPLGYENGIKSSSKSKVFGMDFETNLVQYVRLIFIKQSPDSEIVINGEKKYQYVFGLKNFSAFKTGRTRMAKYQSKPFKFKNNISKVSLSSESEVPTGCNISYSISLVNNEGASLSNFIPISPSNVTSDGLRSVINFNTTKYNSLSFVVQDSGDERAISYGSRTQGKDFYRIGPSLPYPAIFGTSTLYRGSNCWYRDASDGFKLVNESDVYVSFSHSDIEALYSIKKEVKNLITRVDRTVQVTLDNLPYYNSSRGHLLKPDPNLQGSIDIKPNYAIYSVKQIAPVGRRGLNHDLTNTRVQNLSVTNISLLPSVLPPVVSAGYQGFVYRSGIDYEIVSELIGGIRKSTGTLRIPDGSALLDDSGNVRNITLSIVYSPDTDITHKAESLNGDVLTLNNCIVSAAEHIEVEYRYIPITPSEIVKASIRVADGPTTASTINYYIEGTDYLTDPRTGAIQRIPTGRIPNNGDVYVSFAFRNSEEGIHTFQTWCKIEGTKPVQIKFSTTNSGSSNNLILQKELGEGLFVNSPDGFFDISTATRTPVLNPGWIQFIVRSKNPDANTVYGDNLIDQVIQLRDENSKRIFRQQGLYFSEITALRDGMKQISLNHLKVNTLKSNHSFFAIDDTTDPGISYVVINFIPGQTEELYNRVASAEQDTDTRPSQVQETFLLIWYSELEQGIQGNQLVVKIELERSPEIGDGGITPKVHKYDIKVG